MGWADDLLENPQVDLMAQARLGGASSPTSIQQQPEPVVAMPRIGGPIADPNAGPRPGGRPGGGPISGKPTSEGGLVSWRGGRVDRSMVPYLDELMGRYRGLRLSSSYRSAADNARANGAKKSNHLTGHAADFVGSAREMNDAAGWARQRGAKEAMVHNAGSGYHLHVAW